MVKDYGGYICWLQENVEILKNLENLEILKSSIVLVRLLSRSVRVLALMLDPQLVKIIFFTCGKFCWERVRTFVSYLLSLTF